MSTAFVIGYYLRISIRLLLAACFAGNIPNVIPTKVETENASTKDFNVTMALNGSNTEMDIAIIAPSAKPIIPPSNVKNIASNRNCSKICLGLAPIDRRIPISCVRFDTEIYIIFITPIPAIKREIPAIALMKYVNASITVFIPDKIDPKST